MVRKQLSLKRATAALAAIGLAFGLNAAAHATLVGDEVVVQLVVDGAVSSGGPTTVSADDSDAVTLIDVPAIGRLLTVDVNAFTIAIEFLGGAFFAGPDFNGIVISDLDWQDGDFVLTGIEVDVGSTFPNWSDDRATSTGDSLSLNFAGLEVGPFSMLIDLMREGVGNGGTDPGPGPTPVAEPQTLALLGLGLLALGVVRRRFG